MLSEGHVFICVRHQFPNEPLRFLSPLVLHGRSLFPAITLLLLMSWVGSPPVMPHAFKAQSGSAPAWGKRMGGWKLEKNAAIIDKREKVQKKEWPWVTTGKHREALCVDIVGLAPCCKTPVGKGTEVAYTACVCVYVFVPKPLSCLQRAECDFNGQKRWKRYIGISFFHVL